MSTKEYWTGKHDAYCLKHNITGAAKELWRWILRDSKYQADANHDPDLNEFNEWVARHRPKGGYSRPTLKNALAKLEECGVIEIKRRFCWHAFRLKIQSIAFLVQSGLKKNFQNRKQISTLEPETRSNSQTGTNSSSIIDNTIGVQGERVLDTCEEAGIHYDRIHPGDIIRFSWEQVTKAIALFKLRGGFERIDNPQGWLINCCRMQWWKNEGRLQAYDFGIDWNSDEDQGDAWGIPLIEIAKSYGRAAHAISGSLIPT